MKQYIVILEGEDLFIAIKSHATPYLTMEDAIEDTEKEMVMNYAVVELEGIGTDVKTTLVHQVGNL